MKYYRIKNKEMIWGDYGNILLSGMTGHQNRYNGMLQLERTGPFQPNIIISGLCDLLVIHSFKLKIQESGLFMVDFLPVIKKHIVDIDWLGWDLKAEHPKFYPLEGSPENYILELPHSESVVKKMEESWEIISPTNAWIEEDGIFISKKQFSGIFKVENALWIIITETIKEWLEQNQADWLAFEEIKVLGTYH